MTIKKILSLFTTAMALTISLVLATGAALAADAKIRWKGQSVFGLASPLGGGALPNC